VRRARLRAAGTATLVLGLTVLAAHEAAARESAGTKATVGVTEKEFTLKPARASAPPGPVTFVVKNAGKLDHEFVVLKTNLAPARLPQRGTKAAEPGRVGKIPPFKPGATKRLTLNMRAGKYVLICNVATHYKAGQRSAFRVR
jgi:uncharacterized cupredoxin-like copper-binding protein